MNVTAIIGIILTVVLGLVALALDSRETRKSFRRDK